MVDSDTFIETTGDGSLENIDIQALASAIFSSYLMTAFAGMIAVAVAVVKAPLDLFEDLLGWIAETIGLGFTVPESSISTAWTNAADIFPLTGAFDWALGVVLIVVFFLAVRWMFGQVREGL